ncbi:TonB-dependent receptor plug domain-containing protein [Zhongshania sp.]|uniref:TonB-dependent receptor plug domain-containing protein n=1 Tax=Zhongshania sp. TaxID=1971902 RepID=UPI003562CAF6
MPKMKMQAVNTHFKHTSCHGVLPASILYMLIAPSVYAVNSQPAVLARVDDLASLSLESLMNIDVVSVSKRSEPLQQSPAAVFVLDGSTIIRSGVKSIPEALRLIPGLQVARLDSHSYAITARGFNSTVADKLEVLMDGRSLYTPLYSGVFWDAQDTLMDDIERIEVIRGPGAALWGANAVNGVVNIVTKSAANTQGGFQQAGGGGEFDGFAAWRYGGKAGALGHYRVYAKTTHYAPQESAGAGDANDGRNHDQLGFRTDLQLSESDKLTLQGDLYKGRIDNPLSNKAESTSGYNVIARWKRRYDNTADTEVQFVYDQSSRDDTQTFTEDRNIYDVEIKHRFTVGTRQNFVLGGGYHTTDDNIGSLNPAVLKFEPSARKDETVDVFVQDQIELIENKLHLTLGAKYENNDYTGDEFQPSARFSYIVNEHNTVWGAVSRAVRIPNRLDHTIDIFGGVLVGDENFTSEEVIAYELGYRALLNSEVSADVAVFYNEYDKLRSFTDDFLNPQAVPVRFVNDGAGRTQGLEIAVRWEPLPAVKILASYVYQDMDVAAKFGSRDLNIAQNNENDPTNQVNLRLDWDIADSWSVQARARWVDALDDVGVRAYSAFDVTSIWRLSPRVELSLIGTNLLDPQHAEFSGGNEIGRSVHGQFTWHF